MSDADEDRLLITGWSSFLITSYFSTPSKSSKSKLGHYLPYFTLRKKKSPNSDFSVSAKFKLLTSGKSKLWIAIVMLSISFLVIMPAGDFCFRVQKSVDASHKEMRVILKMR